MYSSRPLLNRGRLGMRPAVSWIGSPTSTVMEPRTFSIRSVKTTAGADFVKQRSLSKIVTEDQDIPRS